MEFRVNRPERSPKSADDHGLQSFRQPREAEGISLDQLNSAFAQMLDQGSDPYRAAHAHRAADSLMLGDNTLRRPVSGETDEASAEMAVTPRGILEAALFVGNPTNEPLKPEQIAQHMRGVRPAEVEAMVAELNAEYLANGCPFHIVQAGGGYRMALRDEFEELRNRCTSRQRRARLSTAAIEVLSIVAYNQPTSIAEVDRLRGKSSSALLRQLVRRQLVCVERSESQGRTTQFRTTERFLELFGLSRIEELPRREEIDRH